MDIVKRAYFRIADETAGDQDTWEFKQRVRAEIIRLIKVRAYSGREWPHELGPFPEDLRAKRKGER